MSDRTQRRRLAEELVRVRVRAGLTGRDMARALHVSQAQLYRYDHAVTTPSIPKVRAWLDACRSADPEALDAAERARIVELAESAHAEPRSWTALAGTDQLQDVAAEQDVEAVQEWGAEQVILPGLLQTSEYALAAVRRADLHGQFDHTKQVAGRLARQAVLFEPGKRWHYLIAERLLTWSPGSDDIMPAQRARLVALAATENVEVAVVPDRAVLKPSGLWWGSFSILAPKDGDRYVVVEGVEAERLITAADEVASFALLWDRLWAASLTGDDAVAFVRSLG